MKTYFSLLDIVRLFAAFWVMNFHYFLGASERLHWYRYGNLGVQLFFIISGFVIVQSMQGKSVREFAQGRFIRLFPLFWILCTVTFVLTLIVPGGKHLSVPDYLSSMTMLGDQFNGYVGYGHLIDASYWTLSIELLFYVGIGIFVSFFSYKNIRYFLMLWFVGSIIAFAFHTDDGFYIKLLLVHHASYFIFGGALALIATSQAKKMRETYIDWVLLFASALFATVMCPQIFAHYYTTPHPLDMSIIIALHILFFIGVPILVYLSPRIQHARTIGIFALLGGITYPLYLMHQTMGNMIIGYVTNTYPIQRDIAAVCFEIAIILLGYIVYCQDKKMRAWLSKKMFSRP